MKLVPLISEKALAGAERSVYMFKVSKEATKQMIRSEVQTAFKVTVTGVATSRTPGKVLRRGRVVGNRAGYKKAIVTLKKGEKIAELEA